MPYGTAGKRRLWSAPLTCRQRPTACLSCTDPVLRGGVAVDPVERTIGTLRTLAAVHDPVWVRFVDSSLSSLGPDLDRLLEAMIAAGLPAQWSGRSRS